MYFFVLKCFILSKYLKVMLVKVILVNDLIFLEICLFLLYFWEDRKYIIIFFWLFVVLREENNYNIMVMVCLKYRKI